VSVLRERLYPELAGAGFAAQVASVIPDLVRAREQLEAAGAQSAIGGFAQMPFEYFGFARGLPALALDVYDRPEKIAAASAVLREALAGRGIASARAVGVPRVFIGLGRAGPATISLEHWEQLVWPSLDYIVATLVAEHLTPVLHCDTDWARALPALRRLPPRSCILELDGHTDIFEAKKVLGDRMCIMGDVPATLLAFGERDEVMGYCRRLIETVGSGGGFILSSGCSIPANARPENVKALAEAAEEWGRY
jgi:uroporphyrinogen-III decarboxylase